MRLWPLSSLREVRELGTRASGEEGVWRPSLKCLKIYPRITVAEVGGESQRQCGRR